MVRATAAFTLDATAAPTRSVGLSGLAAMPAAASCGVNPANVSVALFSELPVLPATGRFRISPTSGAVAPSHRPNADCWPTGHRAASVAARATSGATAWWHTGRTGTAAPPLVATDSTGSGGQYTPSAATVAYAFARSNGVVAATPSVKAPQVSGRRAAIVASSSERNLIPSFFAMSTAFCAPICSSSQTKYVLTERPNPFHIVRSPFIQDGLALAGHQCPPQLPFPSASQWVGSGDGELNEVDSGRPSDSAASMVNILNVEPAWYPAIALSPPTNWLTLLG